MSLVETFLRRIFRYSTAGPALTRYYICPHVKLHRIHSSDDDFHTHPWDGISIIFGYYWEETDVDKGCRVLLNRVYAHRPHKVTIDRPVWTLFIHGNRQNENWSYGKSIKPWEGSDQERANESK